MIASMDPFAAIDLYCERTGPELWSEPLNALSNLGFVLAAILLWRNAGPAAGGREARRLAVLIGLIGVGSGLFHTFGTLWGSWLDVGFIALFILVYVHRFVACLGHAGPTWSGVAVAAFLLADRAWSRVGSLGLNGSEAYLLPWAVLIGLALWSRRLAPAATRPLGSGALLFGISFGLRAIDMRLCEQWPLGTHFGWHLCNAGVLYLCVRGLQLGMLSGTTAVRSSR